MAKFDERVKLEVVQRYLAGSAGAKLLAKEYETHHAVIERWVARYRVHGEAGLRKKYEQYTAEFKLSALRRMEREALSQTQVAALFDLRGGPDVVAKWLRQYHEGGLEGLKPKPRGRPKKMPPPKPPKATPAPADDASALEKLRKENEYLRAEVAYLKKLEALVRANRQAARKERKPFSS